MKHEDILSKNKFDYIYFILSYLKQKMKVRTIQDISNENKINETIDVIVKIYHTIGWWQYMEFKFTNEGSISEYRVYNRLLS